jgi:hypothetical protein
VPKTEKASSHQGEPLHRDVAYEARDANASSIGWVALGVIASAFLIHATIKLSYGYFARAEFRSIQPVTMVSAQPSPLRVPALQVNPAADFENFRASEEQLLTTYGWVDPQKGIVRIPIDEAMKRVIEEGLPPAAKYSASPEQAGK